MYSLRAEKSSAVTCPRGVLEVGQLEKAVREGRWICRGGVSWMVEEGGEGVKGRRLGEWYEAW